MSLTPTHRWRVSGERVVAVTSRKRPWVSDIYDIYDTQGRLTGWVARADDLTDLWEWYEVTRSWDGSPRMVRHGAPLNESHSDSSPDAHDDSPESHESSSPESHDDSPPDAHDDSPESHESSSPESHDDSPLTRTAREVLDRDAQDYEHSTRRRESHGAYTPGGKFLPNITEGGTCK